MTSFIRCVRWPVSRVLSMRLPALDGHSSGMRVATHLTRPTRAAIRKRITRRPYLVLLPVGLAMPFLLPGTRCALTAPFQPCRTFRVLEQQRENNDNDNPRGPFSSAFPGA